VTLPPTLGIIGGSGLYEMPGLEQVQQMDLDTPFGKPSAPIVTGILEGLRVAFLARHGTGHTLIPTEVPYRANIYALKSLGVQRVCSISACGSLREDFAPGDIVIPNQIFDHTTLRPRSFFGDGFVAHVSVADPLCADFSSRLEASVRSTSAKIHRGATFITIEGPRFSTRAESNVYRSWGMSIIGMTTSPEAFLAREAGLCYAVMAHVTDYDVWHLSEQPVTVELVIQTLRKNTSIAEQAVRDLARTWSADRSCDCARALEHALITDPAKVPVATLEKLGALLPKRPIQP